MAKKANSAIEWRNIKVKLGQLQPWGYNPRNSTKKQAAKILESFKEYGQVQTIAVGPALEVYDGHQRLSALLTIHGKDYEIDARQSSRALTDDERRRLVVLLHAGAQGAWDWDALSGWDESLLKSAGMDNDLLQQMNRDAAAMKAMLQAADADGSDVDADTARKSLAERFGIPPFSVLDARQGYWQKRKAAWLALGIQSELGRGENALDISATMAGITDERERVGTQHEGKRDGERGGNASGKL